MEKDLGPDRNRPGPSASFPRPGAVRVDASGVPRGRTRRSGTSQKEVGIFLLNLFWVHLRLSGRKCGSTQERAAEDADATLIMTLTGLDPPRKNRKVNGRWIQHERGTGDAMGNEAAVWSIRDSRGVYRIRVS